MHSTWCRHQLTTASIYLLEKLTLIVLFEKWAPANMPEIMSGLTLQKFIDTAVFDTFCELDTSWVCMAGIRGMSFVDDWPWRLEVFTRSENGLRFCGGCASGNMDTGVSTFLIWDRLCRRGGDVLISAWISLQDACHCLLLVEICYYIVTQGRDAFVSCQLSN